MKHVSTLIVGATLFDSKITMLPEQNQKKHTLINIHLYHTLNVYIYEYFYISVKKNCLYFQFYQIDKVKTILTECFEQVM